MPFTDDVRAQPEVLRRLVAAYQGPEAPRLERAVACLREAEERPLLVIGMGSSLSAGRALAGATDRMAFAEDAGEILHYGAGRAARAGAIVAFSQSGRSYETVAVVERLRGTGSAVPVVAVVNDLESPLARSADVALPLFAGREANVATKTYVASVAVALMLARGGLDEALAGELLRTAAAMDELGASGAAAAGSALLGDCPILVVVGRGPSLGAAHYAALTTKESAARAAEAMTGGAFRHGPLELAGSSTGVVVIAPAGPTASLGNALAGETAGLGSPTWLLGGSASATGGSASATGAGLLVTPLPELPEPLAALVAIVPLQLAAADYAHRAGREPGMTRIATKVTDRE